MMPPLSLPPRCFSYIAFIFLFSSGSQLERYLFFGVVILCLPACPSLCFIVFIKNTMDLAAAQLCRSPAGIIKPSPTSSISSISRRASPADIALSTPALLLVMLMSARGVFYSNFLLVATTIATLTWLILNPSLLMGHTR